MISLFTQFVMGPLEIPIIDPRIANHVDIIPIVEKMKAEEEAAFQAIQDQSPTT